MKTIWISMVVLAIIGFSAVAPAQVAHSKTSGIYLTAGDYKEGRLAFEGDCRSKGHKLELHDVLHKAHIHVTHEGEKRKYEKGDLFGFRACDGHDYRFVANLEYQILEARDLYIYALDSSVSHWKGYHTVREYYFSVGPGDPVRALTLEKLKQAFPNNHRLHDSLDATFGTGQPLGQYDDFHKMFKVNRLLIASRERQP